MTVLSISLLDKLQTPVWYKRFSWSLLISLQGVLKILFKIMYSWPSVLWLPHPCGQSHLQYYAILNKGLTHLQNLFSVRVLKPTRCVYQGWLSLINQLLHSTLNEWMIWNWINNLEGHYEIVCVIWFFILFSRDAWQSLHDMYPSLSKY